MIRKLFSSRQTIALDVFGNRTGEREFTDVAATQEKADLLGWQICNYSLDNSSVTMGINRAKPLFVPPLIWLFELFDDARLLHFEN